MTIPMVTSQQGLCRSADGAPEEVGDSQRVTSGRQQWLEKVSESGKKLHQKAETGRQKRG